MATYSAFQLVGKSLIPKKAVKVFRYPNQGVITTATPGQSLGTVYGWVNETNEGSPIYWKFLDKYNRPYYVKHEENAFDVSNLKDQGVITVAEETKREKEKKERQEKQGTFNLPGNPFEGATKGLGNAATTGIIIVAAAIAAKIAFFNR